MRSLSPSVHAFAFSARGQSRGDRPSVIRRLFDGGARGCSEGPGRVLKFVFRILFIM